MVPFSGRAFGEHRKPTGRYALVLPELGTTE